MRKRAARYEMDMTSGPLLMNMLRFALPLMASSVLQLLYNAADMVVVGQFAGANALASVGATGAITSLLVNLFMGFSVGASVAVAQHYGAGSYKDVSQSVHTAVSIALICGVGIGVLGAVLARPLLQMMNTPADILDIKETETEATTPAASEKDPQTGDGMTGNESAPSESGPALESDPAVQTEDIPYVDNGGEKYYVYGVDVTVASDRYVLEIKKEDETATFEKETKEPETEKQTEKATEAPTTAETTTAATAETTTTEAQTTAAPTTAETTTEVPTTVLPESSDTSSSGETTTGPEGTETAPVSPDTSEPADTNEPQELDTTGEGDAKAASEPKETDSSNGEDSVRK